jgi:hypothetical protein
LIPLNFTGKKPAPEKKRSSGTFQFQAAHGAGLLACGSFKKALPSPFVKKEWQRKGPFCPHSQRRDRNGFKPFSL